MGRPRVIPRPTREQVVEWVEAGWTNREIAAHLGVRLGWLYELRREYGLASRRTPPAEYFSPLEGKAFDVFLGSMLGDGFLVKPRASGRVCFSEAHAMDQHDYLKWKREVWGSLANPMRYTRARRQVKLPGQRNPVNMQAQCRFTTKRLRALERWRELFYGWNPEGAKQQRKQFPEEVIEAVTPLALAVWYMDDGHLNKESTAHISCHPRSLDVALRVLAKFGVTAHKGRSWLYISGESGVRFFTLIRPHMHPSMKYKLPLLYRLRDEELDMRAPAGEVRAAVEQEGLRLPALAGRFKLPVGVMQAWLDKLEIDLSVQRAPYAHEVRREGGRGTVRLPEARLRELVTQFSVGRAAVLFGVDHRAVVRELRRYSIPFEIRARGGGLDRYPHITDEAVVQLHSEGLSVAAMCRRLECSRSVVLTRMARSGLR